VRATDSGPDRATAFACLAVCGLIWGTPNIVIRFLKHDFDPVTQSFIRYLAASAALCLPLCTVRRAHLAALRLHWRSLLVPAVVLTIHQLLYVVGLYHTSAMTGVFVSKLSAVVIPLLSCMVFEDERRIVRDPRFVRGATLALAGVAGLTLAGEHAVRDTAWFGPPLMFASMLGWSVYAVLIKPVVRQVPPLALSAAMPLICCVMFLPFLLMVGDLTVVARVPLPHTALLVLSGVFIIAIGNTCYYAALNTLGTSVTAMVLLVTPLTAGVLAHVVLGEHLRPVQALFGLVLLSGCFVISSMVAGSGARQAVPTPPLDSEST